MRRLKKYTFEENYVTDGNSIPALNEVSNLQMENRVISYFTE
jgi:hypothetical protein